MIKKYFYVLLLVSSVFLINLTTNTAYASGYDQTDGSAGIVNTVVSVTLTAPSNFSLTSLEIAGTLSSANTCSSGTITGGYTGITLTDLTAGGSPQIGVATTSAISLTGTTYFSFSSPINIIAGHVIYITSNNPTYNNVSCSGASTPNAYYDTQASSANPASLNWYQYGASYVPVIYLNASVPNSYSVYFNTQTFPSNLQTADFLNWNVCLTSPANFNGNVKVNYGTSTPSGTTDSLSGTLGVPNVSLSNGNCVIITKSATSTAGSLVAQAVLYDNVGNSIATSTILNLTITNGQAVSYPNQAPIFSAPATCASTSFTVLGADFGENFCKLMRFLFVPDQGVINQWTGLKGTMQVHEPFSYFYDLTNSLQNLSTSTTATVTPLTLSTGSGTPVHLTFDMFSANTIDKYTDPTSRSLLRTVIQYALYLAFIAMVILEIRHMFTHNKPKP